MKCYFQTLFLVDNKHIPTPTNYMCTPESGRQEKMLPQDKIFSLHSTLPNLTFITDPVIAISYVACKISTSLWDWVSDSWCCYYMVLSVISYLEIFSYISTCLNFTVLHKISLLLILSDQLIILCNLINLSYILFFLQSY